MSATGKYANEVFPATNTNLIAMRCIGCGTDHPVDDYTLGCPDCRGHGTAANLYCRYRAATPGDARLPLTDATTLGEGSTPLFKTPHNLGLTDVDLWIKDESANPTGSHKDRFNWSAVGRAAASGYRGVMAASSGNAALSVAAYAAAYNLECDLAMTAGVPETVLSSVQRMGATAHIFEHSDERWDYTARFARNSERLTVTNNVKPVVGCSPFGIDGFKSLAWEIWNEWHALPDHMVLPTSRGDLAFGVYLGMAELSRHFAVRGPRIHLVEPLPRLTAVRAGARIHDTFAGSDEHARSIGGNTTTVQALEVLNRCGGEPIVVSPQSTKSAHDTFARHGLLYEASSSVVLPAAADLRDRQVISAGDSTILVMTSHAFKGL